MSDDKKINSLREALDAKWHARNIIDRGPLTEDFKLSWKTANDNYTLARIKYLAALEKKDDPGSF